jgi:hypothetical protein
VEDEPAAELDEGAANAEHTLVEVDIFPSQPQELPAAHPRQDC